MSLLGIGSGIMGLLGALGETGAALKKQKDAQAAEKTAKNVSDIMAGRQPNAQPISTPIAMDLSPKSLASAGPMQLPAARPVNAGLVPITMPFRNLNPELGEHTPNPALSTPADVSVGPGKLPNLLDALQGSPIASMLSGRFA